MMELVNQEIGPGTKVKVDYRPIHHLPTLVIITEHENGGGYTVSECPTSFAALAKLEEQLGLMRAKLKLAEMQKESE